MTPAPAVNDAVDAVVTAAQKLEQQGKFAEARAAYEAALTRAPHDVRGLHRLAVVCTAMDDHAAAAGYYNRALTLAPQNVDLLTDAGYACYLRGEYEAAEALLRDAVTRAPQHERAANNLALVLGMTGRMEESLAAFWQVNPPVDAWKNMAFVYQQRSEWDAAIACYDEAKQLDSTVTTPAALLAHRTAAPPAAAQLTAAESVTTQPSPVTAASARNVAEIFESPAETVSEPPPEIAEPPAADPFVIDEQDFGPFEPPVIVEPESSTGETSARRSSSKLPLGAVPLITPGWPSAPHDEEAVDPALPVVIADRPWKRSLGDVPFDVVYETDEDVAPEPITSETIELAGYEWAEPVVTETIADPLVDEPVASPSVALSLADCCLVALHDDRRLVAARPEFAVAYRDQRFCFSSAAAAQRFADDPDGYLPAAGGLDVVAVRRGWIVVAGTLDHAVWFRGKLFLFASADNLADFQVHPYRYVDYE